MQELEKVVRVMGKKLDLSAPHEVMLVLDAGTGQNANQSAKQFKAVRRNRADLTKLDGTAKGGVIFALAQQLAIPVRFIAQSEGIDDLRPLNARTLPTLCFQYDRPDKREDGMSMVIFEQVSKRYDGGKRGSKRREFRAKKAIARA